MQCLCKYQCIGLLTLISCDGTRVRAADDIYKTSDGKRFNMAVIVETFLLNRRAEVCIYHSDACSKGATCIYSDVSASPEYRRFIRKANEPLTSFTTLAPIAEALIKCMRVSGFDMTANDNFDNKIMWHWLCRFGLVRKSIPCVRFDELMRVFSFSDACKQLTSILPTLDQRAIEKAVANLEMHPTPDNDVFLHSLCDIERTQVVAALKQHEWLTPYNHHICCAVECYNRYKFDEAYDHQQEAVSLVETYCLEFFSIAAVTNMSNEFNMIDFFGKSIRHASTLFAHSFHVHLCPHLPEEIHTLSIPPGAMTWLRRCPGFSEIMEERWHLIFSRTNALKDIADLREKLQECHRNACDLDTIKQLIRKMQICDDTQPLANMQPEPCDQWVAFVATLVAIRDGFPDYRILDIISEEGVAFLQMFRIVPKTFFHLILRSQLKSLCKSSHSERPKITALCREIICQSDALGHKWNL